MRRHRAGTGDRVPAWGRGKLVALLSGAVTVVVLIALGLVLALYYTLHPARDAAARQQGSSMAGGPTNPAGTPASGIRDTTAAAGSAQAREDALAAKPMPTVDLDASRPGTVSARDPGDIVTPTATMTGPAGVPTGFPHTPQGALAQLAAIDQTAMQTASLDGVRAVITSWAAPGGPTPSSWSAVQAIAEFLDSAGLSGGGSQQMSLVVTPLMGLIKGTVGPDFVVPCVDFEFDATITVTQRVADADCQRMLWQNTRWVIGPGPEPANPPSVWPDTDTAISVGYQDLRHG
jgi:hypothetical protein